MKRIEKSEAETEVVEEEVHKLNQYLESIIDNANVWLDVLDKQGNVVIWNKAAEKISGYSRQEVVGHDKIWEWLYPDDEYHKEITQKAAAIIEENEVAEDFETTIRRKDGQSRIISWNSRNLLDEKANPIGSIALGRDITEKKRTESKLEAIEEISRRMKLATDKDQIYDLVMNCTKDVLGYHNCDILEAKGDTLEMVKERGYTSSFLGRRYPLEGKGIVVASFNKGEPIYVPEVGEDKRYIEDLSETRCEYAVPISIGEDEYGVLNVENDKLDSIPANDRNLLQILASEMAVALKGWERLKKLTELHDGVDQLQQCETEEEICETSVKVAEKILDFHMCSIDLLEGDYLVTKAVSSGHCLEDTRPFKVGDGFCGKSFQIGKTMWADDLREVPEAKPVRSDLRSIISVPIGKLGVFAVISTEVGSFSQEDVNLTELLANHLREEIGRVRLQEELRQQAIRDSLTGLYNRRYFNQTIQKEVERAKRYGYSLGFLMLDINDFKEVNDRYSHLTGDQVLKEIANLIKENVRDADTVVRYGGDEFLILLPETNGEPETDKIKNRISDKLKEWNQGNHLIDFPLTVAMGTSYWSPEKDKEVEEVLKKADRRMYKDKGRR